MQPKRTGANQPGGTAAANESNSHEAAADRRTTSLWASNLDQWLIVLNIERFREQLEYATDLGHRVILLALIEAHTARLERSQRASAL
ncbi:MAG TPA: hypothetical protein VMB34_17140 [Acetobacteraceae bacterium]|nr:hypothetical protein [Acetobacteraceae bacterium]